MRGASDNARRSQDVRFLPAGSGLSVRFRCGRCDKASQMPGSATRAVAGLRTKVCAACKEALDAKA